MDAASFSIFPSFDVFYKFILRSWDNMNELASPNYFCSCLKSYGLLWFHKLFGPTYVTLDIELVHKSDNLLAILSSFV